MGGTGERGETWRSHQPEGTVWQGCGGVAAKAGLEEQQDPREERVPLAGHEDKIRRDKLVVIGFLKGVYVLRGWVL